MDYLIPKPELRRCPRGYILVGNACVLLEDDLGLFGETRPRVVPPIPQSPTPQPPIPETPLDPDTDELPDIPSLPPLPETPTTDPQPTLDPDTDELPDIPSLPPLPETPQPTPQPPQPDAKSKQTIFVPSITNEQLIEIASGAGIILTATVASQLLSGSATSNIISVVASEEGTMIEMTPLIGRNGEVLFQDLEEGEEGFFEGTEVAGETGIQMSELSETISTIAEDSEIVAEGQGASIFSAESQGMADVLLGETGGEGVVAGEGLLETDVLLEGVGTAVAEGVGLEAGIGISAVALPLLITAGSAVASSDLVKPDSKLYAFFGGKAPLDPQKDAEAQTSTILARDPYVLQHQDPPGSYYLDQNARNQYYIQLVASLNDGTQRSDQEVAEILQQANDIRDGGDVYVYQDPTTKEINTYQIPNDEQRELINQQLALNPNYFVDQGIPPIVVYNMGYNEALAYNDEDKQFLRGLAYGYAYDDDRTNAEIVADGDHSLPHDEYKYSGLEKAQEGDVTESGEVYVTTENQQQLPTQETESSSNKPPPLTSSPTEPMQPPKSIAQLVGEEGGDEEMF